MDEALLDVGRVERNGEVHGDGVLAAIVHSLHEREVGDLHKIRGERLGRAGIGLFEIHDVPAHVDIRRVNVRLHAEFQRGR